MRIVSSLKTPGAPGPSRCALLFCAFLISAVVYADSPAPPVARPDTGPGANLHGMRAFPPDNPWNQDISRLTVDPNSEVLLSSVGLEKPLHPDFGPSPQGGIPYVVVPGVQPRVPVVFDAADAAGLPIFPGLARYDEAHERGAIQHALRLTVERTRRGYVYPARHFASRSTSPALPPMGMRVRLKASYELAGFPHDARVILQALKTYGMILADNGGDWFVSGAPDPRWDDDILNTLKRVKVKDFEVVQMGPVTTTD